MSRLPVVRFHNQRLGRSVFLLSAVSTWLVLLLRNRTAGVCHQHLDARKDLERVTDVPTKKIGATVGASR